MSFLVRRCAMLNPSGHNAKFPGSKFDEIIPELNSQMT